MRRCTLDSIKMNLISGTVSAAVFQAVARIRSLYVELLVLAAQLRMSFLHSQLFRWGHMGSLGFTIRG